MMRSSQKIIKEIGELELKLATKWDGMPEGWTQGSRKQFWESMVGEVEHKRTKCFEKIRPHLPSDDAAWAFCQSLWDDFENK